jgi:hypothetical protein
MQEKSPSWEAEENDTLALESALPAQLSGFAGPSGVWRSAKTFRFF